MFNIILRKMTYKLFLKILLNHKKIEENISKLYDVGVNVLDGKYGLSDKIYELVSAAFSSHYTEEGVDWINWFIYENEYGQKDWSKVRTYKQNEDGKLILLEKSDQEIHYGAVDKNNNPIAYSYESLYRLLEDEYKRK